MATVCSAVFIINGMDHLKGIANSHVRCETLNISNFYSLLTPIHSPDMIPGMLAVTDPEWFPLKLPFEQEFIIFSERSEPSTGELDAKLYHTRSSVYISLLQLLGTF